jgi:NADPH:quinone reductase-like Zn-dependent oxidoreductase
MRLAEVDKPKVADDRVLVRVHAASVNAYDWHILRGKPYIARLSEGLRRPKTTVLGLDVAGIAEAVGAGVTDIHPGDRVFGSRLGAFAEYVCGKNMVPMPAGLTFEQAAAVPTAGYTALQGLRDVGGLREGQRVLVNGAGGGVGHFAVQIAKAIGAEVTAVTSTKNIEMVRAIGADHVIDYTRDDFTRSPHGFDLIFDAGGNRSLRALRRALTPNGTAVLAAPAPGQWIDPLVRIAGAVVLSRLSRQQIRPFLAKPSKDDLLVLKELIEAGKLRPVIDRTYPFREIPQAVRHVETGQASGKVVITMATR